MKGRLFFGVAVLILMSLVLVASAQRQTGRVVVANDFPGQDLDAKINADNFIDVRQSEVATSGNGIVVQATLGTTLVGPILVEQNTIIGGSNQGTITNILSNGIYVFGPTMRDVIVRNNTITRTGQSGMRV